MKLISEVSKTHRKIIFHERKHPHEKCCLKFSSARLAARAGSFGSRANLIFFFLLRLFIQQKTETSTDLGKAK